VEAEGGKPLIRPEIGVNAPGARWKSLPPQTAPIPRWKAKWKCKSPWIFMAGITAQSPAKGLGAFDPGLDPGEEWAKGGVRLRGPSPWSGEGPERQIERSAWLRQRSAKDPKGKSSVPPGFASGTRKRRPPPRSGDKALPPCATCAAEGRTIRSRNLGGGRGICGGRVERKPGARGPRRIGKERGMQEAGRSSVAEDGHLSSDARAVRR